MKRIKYFGTICVCFAIALAWARWFDARGEADAINNRKAECGRAMRKHEQTYIEAIRALRPTDAYFNNLIREYESSSEFEVRIKKFSELEVQGSVITSSSDVSNPTLRKKMDEALGALNRRREVMRSCGDVVR